MELMGILVHQHPAGGSGAFTAGLMQMMCIVKSTSQLLVMLSSKNTYGIEVQGTLKELKHIYIPRAHFSRIETFKLKSKLHSTKMNKKYLLFI